MLDKPAIARDQLRSVVERIEKLEEEKTTIGGDIREVYSEAKSQGFDVKALRKIVTLRKIDIRKRQEDEAILDTYMSALGMLGSPTPAYNDDTAAAEASA
ncbi:MAG: DUF2312 domain-containing protein [Pseudomonadota bacterium]